MFEEHNTCKYDRIELFDGGNSDAPSLGVFCGSDVPPSVQSTSNQLYLTMLTDASVDRRGFKAFYSSGFLLTSAFQELAFLNPEQSHVTPQKFLCDGFKVTKYNQPSGADSRV